MATVNSFAAAAEESGVAVEGKAFDLALNSVVKVLKEKVGSDVVLSFSADMDEIKAKMIEDVGKYSTDTSGVMSNRISSDYYQILSNQL